MTISSGSFNEKGGVAALDRSSRLKVTKVDVIILAGAPNTSLAEVSDAKWEALVDVGGRPMVDYVLETMLKLDNLGKLILVGPEELKDTPPNVSFTLCKGSLVANLMAGVEALGLESERSPYLLVVTSDIPLITKEAIDDFLTRSFMHDAKIYYPIVSREANEKSYPEVERTYFTLKEGTFTGGNIILLDPELLKTKYELVEQLTALRKSPAKIIKMLGVKFIYKFVRKTLSIEEIETRAKVILGAPGKAIISQYPEIGIDVDKPSDLSLMERLFAVKS